MDFEIRKADFKTALGYMGIREKQADSRILEELSEALELLKKECRPKGHSVKCDISVSEKGVLLFNGAVCLPGREIKRLLENSDKGFIICATLGINADRTIRSLQYKDMRKALVTDAAASSAVEDILDQVIFNIENDLKEDEFLTFRFAPGYGDLPIGCNRQLSEMAETYKAAGIYANESGTLSPLKSVIAIVGVKRKQP